MSAFSAVLLLLVVLGIPVIIVAFMSYLMFASIRAIVRFVGMATR